MGGLGVHVPLMGPGVWNGYTMVSDGDGTMVCDGGI